MRLELVVVLAVLSMATVPGRLAAQAAVQPIAPQPVALVAAAQLRLPTGHPFALERPLGARMTQGARGNQRQAEILMIVGAAGIVTGLVAHEDLITIAGAGVGGFGLYRYLQATR